MSSIVPLALDWVDFWALVALAALILAEMAGEGRGIEG